eukprot:14622114-Alexandrium_andersonii.AAC.1
MAPPVHGRTEEKGHQISKHSTRLRPVQVCSSNEAPLPPLPEHLRPHRSVLRVERTAPVPLRSR